MGARGAIAEFMKELGLASVCVVKSTRLYGRKESHIGRRLKESVDDGGHEGGLMCLGLLCRLR
jgi:hypothetical protein